MRTLIAAALLLCVTPVAMADEAMLCLKNVGIGISELIPNGVHFADHVDRKSKILLRMNVDCKSEQVLVPSSPSEAKDWLDLALPYDFKSGMTGGPFLSADAYTPYGYSVEYDLNQYFTKTWKLEPDSAVCKAFPRKSYEKEGKNWCFYNLLDSNREDYKNPKALSPGGQRG